MAPSALILWQRRLLPLMGLMLVGVTLFFFAVTFAQLLYLQREIGREPPVRLSDAVLAAPLASFSSPTEQLAGMRFRAAAEMEVQVVTRRYRQATVLLMSRVWTLYLGFVTGMILALVGAAFILGRLQEPASEVSVDSPAGKWGLKSASPGIILAVLGTALMLTTILTNHRIDVTDAAVYLRESPSILPPASVLPLPTVDSPLSPVKRD